MHVKMRLVTTSATVQADARLPGEHAGQAVAPQSPQTPVCCGLTAAPLSAADAAALAPMFKALGDPVRLRMASMIASVPELCVCEITPAFELSSGTISHHLKTLRDAGLVDSERRGTFVWYRVRPQALSALLSPTA